MGELIDIKKPSSMVQVLEPKTGIHLTGTALCFHCKAEWQSVCIPEDDGNLECPSCGKHIGILKHPIQPDLMLECSCGSVLYFVTPDGLVCRKCGKIPRFDKQGNPI